ncbi:MAG: purine-binding chemotaxis protein CheW [Leptolyngbya sp. SIO3F4]|nr:purine-binding chemotaxis protein CheW [Leptolyngbya sp. SIO3F4]
MQQHNCWNQVGVSGDHSCPTLATVVHCQNCSVYRQAGRGLLERPIPEDYASEWTTLLTHVRSQRQSDDQNTLSINIFRLGQEWLALPTRVIKQVLPTRPVHSIPHRSNKLLKGIVNVQGQLLLCVSLYELLGIDTAQAINQQATNAERSSYLLVVEKNRDIWAFEVDKLYGLHRCTSDSLRNAPSLGRNPLGRFTRAIVSWQDENVSYLDEACLFEALQQGAL